MSWLTPLFPWFARRGPRRRPRIPTRRRTCRLTLERLEARDVPSTLVVTNDSDTGVPGDGSLRGEIAAAHSGDTIRFDGSLHGQTIALDPVKGPLELGKDLTIRGLGAGQITISGGNATEVFRIDGGATDTLDQLTIANGSAILGGGILNFGTLAVDHSTLSGNSAGVSGGGIANHGGTVTVDHSTLSGNSAGFGGGIYNDLGGTLNVYYSIICGNSAPVGADVYNLGTLNQDHSDICDVGP